MEKAEYTVIRRCEDRHWWYVGLHDLALATVEKRLQGQTQATLLDAGCGTGGLLEKMQQTAYSSVGLDYAGHAFEQMQSRHLSGLVKGNIRQMPFEPATFDIVTSMDVLCALKGKDIRGTVEQIHHVLKPGGYLIMNLPAYSWLYSGHDDFVGNLTRFSRPELVRLLHNIGFDVELSTYRNSVLFLPAMLFRLIKPVILGQDDSYASDVRMPPKILNRIFIGILRLEQFMIRLGFRFPFGLSIFLVARKPDLGAYQFTSSISKLLRPDQNRKGFVPCK